MVVGTAGVRAVGGTPTLVIVSAALADGSWVSHRCVCGEHVVTIAQDLEVVARLRWGGAKFRTPKGTSER